MLTGYFLWEMKPTSFSLSLFLSLSISLLLSHTHACERTHAQELHVVNNSQKVKA